MKTWQTLTLLLALGGCRAVETSDDGMNGWRGRIAFPLGYRQLSEDFGDARDQVQVGALDVDFAPPGSPLSIVIQPTFGITEDVPSAAGVPGNFNPDYTTTSQLNLGLRFNATSGPWRPFFGGGVSLVGARLSEERHSCCGDRSESDSTAGLWLGGGVYFQTESPFTIGFGVQYVNAGDVELRGRERDADSLDVSLLLGYSF